MGTRVFVGGLTYKVRERDIEKFFRKYGRIKEVAMKNGFAFVEFDDYRDADDAVCELNGKELLGERVSVERARGTPRGSDQWRGSGGGRGYGPPRGRSRDNRDPDMRSHDNRFGPPTRTNYRLIVENLSSRVSWQDLKDYMRQAGEVTYADAHKQRRNEGVVEFASYNDMKNAVDKLDDTELNGRRIHLIEDKRRGSGGGGGGGAVARHSRSSSSRSRSRSRSRRRSRSRSRSRSQSRSRSRSRSHRSSRSKSRGHSKSKSPARSKSRSRSKNASKSRSRSRSRPKQSKSRSASKDVEMSKDRSRSRSISKDRSKSRSLSPKDASSDKND